MLKADLESIFSMKEELDKIIEERIKERLSINCNKEECMIVSKDGKSKMIVTICLI